MKKIILCLILLVSTISLNAEVKKIYRDGKLYMEYSVDEKGKKTGEYKEYHENGKVSKIGNLNSDDHTYYYKNGKLRSTYTDSEKTTYHESNGSLHSKIYIKNNLIQKIISYYDDGTLEYQFIYKNGKKDGKYIEYYKNGKIKKVKYYKQGKPTSKSITYFENSSIKYTYEYNNNGKLIKTMRYYKSGVLKAIYNRNPRLTREFRVDGSLKKITTSGKGKSLFISISYDKSNNVISIDIPSKNNSKYKYKYDRFLTIFVDKIDFVVYYDVQSSIIDLKKSYKTSNGENIEITKDEYFKYILPMSYLEYEEEIASKSNLFRDATLIYEILENGDLRKTLSAYYQNKTIVLVFINDKLNNEDTHIAKLKKYADWETDARWEFSKIDKQLLDLVLNNFNINKR